MVFSSPNYLAVYYFRVAFYFLQSDNFTFACALSTPSPMSQWHCHPCCFSLKRKFDCFVFGHLCAGVCSCYPQLHVSVSCFFFVYLIRIHVESHDDSYRFSFNSLAIQSHYLARILHKIEIHQQTNSTSSSLCFVGRTQFVSIRPIRLSFFLLLLVKLPVWVNFGINFSQFQTIRTQKCKLLRRFFSPLEEEARREGGVGFECLSPTTLRKPDSIEGPETFRLLSYTHK